MSPKRQTTSIELTADKTGTNIHRPLWASKWITKFTKSDSWTLTWTSLFKFTPAHWRLSKFILIYYPPNYISIHLAVCLTTGPKPLPKRAPHIVRS